MSELVTKADGSTVDNQLTGTEIERLQNAGVEVEQSDEQPDGSGGDGPDLDDVDDDDEEEQQGGGSGSDDQESAEEESEQEGGTGGDGDQSEGDEIVDELGSDGSFTDDELDEMVENSDVANEDVSEDEAREHAEAAFAAGAGDGDIKDCTLEMFEGDDDWKRSAVQLSRHLERVVGEHLRRERKSETSRDEEFGDFDSSRMLSADRGSTKVFQRQNRPGEKEYHTILIMDDSGSMSGNKLANASIATAALTRALESVGIDVTVYRFARNVRLVKTANQTFEQASDAILENRTYGGTCLLPALRNVPDIAEKFADETFVMTITDGMPRKKTDVSRMLNDMNEKNMCLQVDEDSDLFENDYDGFAYVESENQIRTKTESLFRRVVL